MLTKFWTSWATKSLTHHFQPWQLHNLSPNFKAWMFPSLSSKLAIESLQLSFLKPFHLQKRALTSYLGLPVDKVVWSMEWEGGLSEAVSGLVRGGDDSVPTWDVKTLFWGLDARFLQTLSESKDSWIWKVQVDYWVDIGAEHLMPYYVSYLILSCSGYSDEDFGMNQLVSPRETQGSRFSWYSAAWLVFSL